MKFTILLFIVLSIFAMTVSAKPQCSFTCGDGSKVTLPDLIQTKEHCQLAIELSECPKMNIPSGRCIPWCPPCNSCPPMDNLEIVSYSFSDDQ
ncbi:hypothetical protein DFA_08057 [Cavenderia fasciculata]|uniref:Single domain-containing protein n=1 Tax=Cavenderia fasciculata TaxID=261658 RepID=F4Q4W9_CACFS|nr:uncharacterized protein DFA_08057 [Cavenderia fasciculata]EGG17075.1 hypothetical protein DFA_08057 [Cavenderia fasciculata]|eukprot:XP_004355559.1 hypothetical protein DFA_08057 [Cavenderia fasciculata]